MLVSNQCYMFEVWGGVPVLKIENKVIFDLIYIVSNNAYENVCKYQILLTCIYYGGPYSML